MVKSLSDVEILVAMPNQQIGQGVANALRQAKVRTIKRVEDSTAALAAMQHNPKLNVFFIAADLEPHGGIDFCRFIRMTDTAMSKADLIIHIPSPTKETVMDARNAGINKIMVGTISGQAVISQVQDTIAQRKSFIECDSYLGPDRRRTNPPPYTGKERRQS